MGWEQKKESQGAVEQVARRSVQRREHALVGAQCKGPAVGRHYGRGSEEVGEWRDNVKNGPCWALGARWRGNWILRGKGNPAR